MTQAPLDEISIIQDINEKNRRINALIASCPPDDPIFLSDLIVMTKGGNSRAAQEILIALDANEKGSRHPRKPMVWKIQVLRDEWGNIPNPGEQIYKKNKLPLFQSDGKPYPPNYFNTAMITGRYHEEFEEKVPYEVDEKGCIECSFTDAGHFLEQWGIHPNGHQITRKPEHSTEPVRTSEDGQKLHVWYHRYKEMTKESYAKLPPRKPSKEPKREKKAS
jgi:hypothetical protein